MQMKGIAARRMAVDVLVKVEIDKAYANIALSSAFEKQTLQERDRAFTTFLVQGVLRHREELDKDLAALSKQPLAKLTPPVRNLLRIAVFQLKYAEDIPQSAVLNTATEIGKQVGHQGIGRFVTGVLRTFLRNRATTAISSSSIINTTDSDTTLAAKSIPEIAQKYTVPEWLVEKWIANHGWENTEHLLAYSQTVPELTVRTCESGITVEALMNVFTSAGIKFRQGRLVPSCLIIEDRGKHKGPVEKLPGYKDGLFIVQDEAAAFPALAMAAKPGELIVDLCAAPGGKAIQMAEQMENKGRIVAVDLHSPRLELLKQTRRRIGLTNIEATAADGTTFKPDGLADKVLLDAPCTGTGVINRRSDLRFQRQPPDLQALVKLQRSLLANAATMLKPGGTLVYSTCSIEPEENEQNIEWLLQEDPTMRLDSLEQYVPESARSLFQEGQLQRGMVQLMPSQHGVSGFFVARMLKN
jgi:16S rRNA (cytosine967-C5)-methyltransferase